MALHPSLSPEEERVLGKMRYLAKTYKDWSLTVQGQFRSGRQQVRLRTEYAEVLLTGLTEQEFDALD